MGSPRSKPPIPPGRAVLWGVGVLIFIAVLAALVWRSGTRLSPTEGAHSVDEESSGPPSASLFSKWWGQVIGQGQEGERSSAIKGGFSEPIAEFVSIEAERSRGLDSDPAGTEERLRNRAEALTAAEISELEDLARDPEAKGDERALAAFLLGYSAAPAVLDALESIARAPIPKGLAPAVHEAEISVRALSIEGLARQTDDPEAGKRLEELAKDPAIDSFLRSRAQAAARAHTLGDPEGLPKSDKKKLKELLGQPAADDLDP